MQHNDESKKYHKNNKKMLVIQKCVQKEYMGKLRKLFPIRLVALNHQHYINCCLAEETARKHYFNDF